MIFNPTHKKAKLKLPADHIAVMLGVTMRFVPQLFREADNIRYACIEINVFSDNNLRESIDQTFLDKAVNMFKLLPNKSIEIINDYFKRTLAQNGFLSDQEKYNCAWHQSDDRILNPYLTILSFEH